MQVELKANGKTVQVEMTEEQAKILGLAEERSEQDMRGLKLKKHIILLT